LLARQLEVVLRRKLDHRSQGEEEDDDADDRVDPAADHEALGEDPADRESGGEGEEGGCPRRSWRVDQLAGLGDVAVRAHDAM
jgi:hypothetical protein